jgi:hypothetical protein
MTFLMVCVGIPPSSGAIVIAIETVELNVQVRRRYLIFVPLKAKDAGSAESERQAVLIPFFLLYIAIYEKSLVTYTTIFLLFISYFYFSTKD